MPTRRTVHFHRRRNHSASRSRARTHRIGRKPFWTFHQPIFWMLQSISIRQVRNRRKLSNELISLICEAQVFSRNLKHWNEKSKRGKVSQSTHDLIETLVISDGAMKGKVPRLPLLQAFLKERELPSNKTDAGKMFNRWVRDTLRVIAFTDTVPWRPDREDYDKALCETLTENGWIRWVSVGGCQYFVLPDQTEKPSHKPRTKAKVGEHETRPWWTTKTTWWPEPSSKEQKKFKSEYLCDNLQNFQSAYVAKECLKELERWIEVQRTIKEEYGTRKKAQKIDPKTGHFR